MFTCTYPWCQATATRADVDEGFDLKRCGHPE